MQLSAFRRLGNRVRITTRPSAACRSPSPTRITSPTFTAIQIHPALALYVGGNYFFAMAPLVHAFEERYPQYKGHVYWETLSPGLLIKQMDSAGVVTVGNMTGTVAPDVYFAGLKTVQREIDAGLLQAPAVPYVTNTLTIMVPKGNPAHVERLADLGEPGVRLAMPNPAFEGSPDKSKSHSKTRAATRS